MKILAFMAGEIAGMNTFWVFLDGCLGGFAATDALIFVICALVGLVSVTIIQEEKTDVST